VKNYTTPILGGLILHQNFPKEKPLTPTKMYIRDPFSRTFFYDTAPSFQVRVVLRFLKTANSLQKRMPQLMIIDFVQNKIGVNPLFFGKAYYSLAA
jgi:hypothetical protein